MRACLAHVSAVLAASLAIMVGVETIVFGWAGPISGLGKWIGGILIFTVIALISLPFGLSVRWMVGKLPLEPLAGALMGGVIVSIGLMFVLHPAMYPRISFFSHPVSLALVHVMAGLLGAWVWYCVEFGAQETVADE